MMPSIITDFDERNRRIANQNHVLKAFCAAYTSHRCGLTRNTMKLEKPTCEREDRDSILEKIMAFGPGGDSVFCVFEEAKVTAVDVPEDLSYPPTGKIDLIAISEGNVASANAVAILKCVDDYPYPSGCHGADYLPTFDKVIGYNVLPTTAKTKATFNSPGSNRQAVLELLALTEVIVRERGSTEGVKVVIILKAAMNKFQPFIYFPCEDILITTCQATLLEDTPTIRESMMGHLLMFFLLRYKINLEFPSELLKR